MSNHTKGPWILDEMYSSPDILGEHYHSIHAGCGYHSDESDIGFEINGCISTADAHLIAAAPDLLEALEDMLAGWKYIRESHGDLYGVGWDRAQDKATAAIARARGAK